MALVGASVCQANELPCAVFESINLDHLTPETYVRSYQASLGSAEQPQYLLDLGIYGRWTISAGVLIRSINY